MARGQSGLGRDPKPTDGRVLVLPIARWKRITAETVAVLNAAVFPVRDQLNMVTPCRRASALKRISLGVVVRRIALCALAANRPTVLSRYYVNILLRRHSLFPCY